MRNRNGNIFHRYQIFQLDVARIIHNLGFSVVAEILLDLFQLVDDEVFQDFFRTQNFQVSLDALLDVSQFKKDLLPLHAGQALQLQLDDRLRLPFCKFEPAHQ